MRLFSLFIATALASIALTPAARGHGYPDIPVRASFAADGTASITIEIDLRCFVADPINEPYVLNWVLDEMTAAERDASLDQARDLLRKSIELRFEPAGLVSPDFAFTFTNAGGKPLEKLDDPVMITASWRAALPAGVTGYQLHALPECRFGVIFENTLRGEKVERVQVLFPKETSFVLDLTDASTGRSAAPMTGKAGARDGWASFRSHLRAGFGSVVPNGLKTALFIVGMFLLSREWRSLLWQVAAFTMAHSLTLALATLGLLRVSASVVDPLAAAGLVVVATQNIFRQRCTRGRLLVVFAFGLVHGLTFADGLAAQDPGDDSLLINLLGFNVGIECAQLAVIALAFLATAWLQSPAAYRKLVVVPASLAVAVAGIFWAFAGFAGG